MGGVMRGRGSIRPKKAVPHESGQQGTLNHTSSKKADNADSPGSGGNPSPPIRAAGPSPSIRKGVSRGATIAGVGLGAGVAVGVPVLLHKVAGQGLLPTLFGKDGDDGKDGPTGKDPLGVGVSPTLLLLVGGVLAFAYLWQR